MSHIRIKKHKYTESTREPTSDDSWDRGDTSSSWEFESIELLDENDCYDLITKINVEEGKIYYLVTVVFNSGDSFGHDVNGSICMIDLYENEDDAEYAADQIRRHDNSYDRWTDTKNRELHIKMADGTFKKSYCGWHGYFESLSYVEVTSLKVNKDSRTSEPKNKKKKKKV